MTVTTETFTGSNGATAASPWILTTLGGTQNIQSNKWRITNGTGYVGTAMTYGTGTYTDVDLLATITLDATGAEQYPAIAGRLSGSPAGFGTYTEPINGYAAILDPLNDQYGLAVYAGGSQIASAGDGLSLVAGGTYKMRLQLIGTTIQCRAWLASGGEPAGWVLTGTDTNYASGWVGFRDTSPSNVVTSDWDDFTINDSPAGGGTPNVLGLADASLAFASATTSTRTTFATGTSPFVLTTGGVGEASTASGGAAVVAAMMAGR